MKKNNLFVAKLAVVALAVGFFSPSVTVVKNISPAGAGEGYKVNVSLLNTAEARGRARSGNRNRSSNRNRNVNRNKNVNRNRNVNVNRNVHVHGGGGRYYGGGSYNNNNNGAALAAGMIVGAVAVSAASN